MNRLQEIYYHNFGSLQLRNGPLPDSVGSVNIDMTTNTSQSNATFVTLGNTASTSLNLPRTSSVSKARKIDQPTVTFVNPLHSWTDIARTSSSSSSSSNSSESSAGSNMTVMTQVLGMIKMQNSISPSTLSQISRLSTSSKTSILSVGDIETRWSEPLSAGYKDIDSSDAPPEGLDRAGLNPPSQLTGISQATNGWIGSTTLLNGRRKAAAKGRPQNSNKASASSSGQVCIWICYAARTLPLLENPIDNTSKTKELHS